ncbi:LysR family transcriptional regulator [Vibrio parahaemolyticus]|uniref:HTH lysR-type domain-containing protein n=2 Tax=Vibrio parahaemolyticus TaxID=670 RepID=A0AAW3IVF6_VIBPH|nr:LysR family transcriptional regulator [Vibrio parahaemolyticus]EGQ7663320.1 LysR family transcriptional regulator [Vibrio parahaemolyticus]EGQ7829472.1 LysR family transcriptional regulator [Vibrio parahaemolyticus]EGQ9828516.1 LysR family transcriptional regulator [Vibrio parahaemolyticus]EGR0035615.1 LysR family transcriptional regulator [Vibrio parahaemolyticus]EGR0203584.1 LysR family transcriptional regulator [Vibrio parahaemolyticus]
MDLHNRYLDLPLELMKTMVLLYHNPNLKKVGDILKKSESAVSRDITKLRERLNDPIFIRSAQGMELTPLVQQLAPQIEQNYNQIANILKKATTSCTDFSQYTQPIVIALNSYIYQYVAAKLTSVLLQHFPQATFHIQRWGKDTLDAITAGDIDIGVHFSDFETNKDITLQHISEYHVYLACHPDVKITKLDDVLDNLLIIARLPSWNEHRYRLLEKLKIEPKKVVYVDSLATAYEVVQSVPSVSFLPDFIYDNLKVKVIKLDENMSYSFSSFFKQSHRREPFTQHLHNLIQSVVSPKES